jgi:flagellar biosynthetic protein FliP
MNSTASSNTVQLLLLIGGVTLVPALLFTVTGFTRIIVVLGFIRTGLGTPTAPPNQVLVGIALFVKLAKLDRPKTRADVPTYVLIPAFIISELKTAFQIGFLIFLPFLVIDLVVSSTLMSMGMVMLPPVFISLPFKILLFVLVDGWNLVTQSVVESFH